MSVYISLYINTYMHKLLIEICCVVYIYIYIYVYIYISSAAHYSATVLTPALPSCIVASCSATPRRLISVCTVSVSATA